MFCGLNRSDSLEELEKYANNENDLEKIIKTETNKEIEENIENLKKEMKIANKLSENDKIKKFEEKLSNNITLEKKFNNFKKKYKKSQKIKKEQKLQNLKYNKNCDLQKLKAKIIKKFPLFNKEVFQFYMSNRKVLEFELKENINEYPVYQLDDGSIYQGKIVNDKFNGPGKILFSKNSKNYYYEGMFVNNKIDDFGFLIKNNNEYFIGKIKNEKADGEGFYLKRIETELNLKYIIYSGFFKDNLLNGQGILIERSFNIVKDQKARNLKLYKCYKNICFFPHSYNLNYKEIEKDSFEFEINYYFGNFLKGKKNGYGIIKNNNINYEGNFLNDLYNGKGILYDKLNFEEYDGDFVDNKFNGEGNKIYYKKNNENEYIIIKKYIGKFKNNLKHGKGIYSTSKGTKFIGNWNKGKLHGSITIDNNKNYSAKVNFENGIPVKGKK